MKITFIYAHCHKIIAENHSKKDYMYPLSIALLAARTPPDVDVVYYDDRIEPIPFDEATDLVGISVETYNAARAYEIADAYRARGVTVILGGIHVSIVPDEVQTHADSIVVGDGDGLWPDIVKDFKRHRLKPRYVASMEKSQIRHNPPRRDIFRNKYFPADIVEVARGCPHKCAFCSLASVYQGLYRKKSVDDIVMDMRRTCHPILYLADDNFVARPDHSIEMCKAITPFKKHWLTEGSIKIADNDELMKWMARSGCMYVVLGLETLNQKSLKAMNKSWAVSKRNYKEAIEKLRDHGISVCGSFVFGYDDDTEDDFKRALELAIDTKMAHAFFMMLIPMPGTPLYQRMDREGRLLRPTWWLDPQYHAGSPIFTPKSMTPEKLAESCIEARKEFYTYGSVFKRAMDFRANMRTPADAYFFLRSNLTTWRYTFMQDN